MTCGAIAYTYEADHHCIECAMERFNMDDRGHVYGVDDEGNPIHPVLPWDEWWNVDIDECEALVCGDCHERLAEAHHDRCDAGEMVCAIAWPENHGG